MFIIALTAERGTEFLRDPEFYITMTFITSLIEL